MNTTIFLSQVWGPVILAVGVGVFVSRNYYIKIYRDLEKETLAVLLFGIAAIAAGVTHIQLHNSWSSFQEIVISFLGCALLLKGLLFAIVPNIVNEAGDWVVDSKLISAAGVVMLILGIYLMCVGYLI